MIIRQLGTNGENDNNRSVTILCALQHELTCPQVGKIPGPLRRLHERMLGISAAA
jgi:hypothetical protein